MRFRMPELVCGWMLGGEFVEASGESFELVDWRMAEVPNGCEELDVAGGEAVGWTYFAFV